MPDNCNTVLNITPAIIIIAKGFVSETFIITKIIKPRENNPMGSGEFFVVVQLFQALL